jgi:hypothetical protein
MPNANFSCAILEPCPAFLAVAAIPRIVWSDLGTPRRVFAWVHASDLAAS